MKIVTYASLGIIGLVALSFLGGLIASESGEVVILTGAGPSGTKSTRLWVIEIDGIQYLRADPEADWYLPLRTAAEVTLVRGEQTEPYRAETRMDQATALNRHMRAKYGWRDAYIEWLVGGRSQAIPVALIPQG